MGISILETEAYLDINCGKTKTSLVTCQTLVNPDILKHLRAVLAKYNIAIVDSSTIWGFAGRLHWTQLCIRSGIAWKAKKSYPVVLGQEELLRRAYGKIETLWKMK